MASGDPYLYGVGAAGAPWAAETVVVPAPSAFSLAAARLSWALADCALVSLHGRELDRVRPHLQPGARVLALTSDGDGPGALAGLLAASGFGASRLTVLEALGGPRERIRTVTAAQYDLGKVDPLNTVAIEVAAAAGARIIPRPPGLPDALFEHDGQITKREVRAVTISSLAPRRGELLLGLGAGAGSIRIEWMLIRRCARSQRKRNAQRASNQCGELQCWSRIVQGAATRAGRIAGRGCDLHRRRRRRPGVLDAALAALRGGGRLVVNAATLQTEAISLALFSGGGIDPHRDRVPIRRQLTVGAPPCR